MPYNSSFFGYAIHPLVYQTLHCFRHTILPLEKDLENLELFFSVQWTCGYTEGVDWIVEVELGVVALVLF